ncbi:MAG: hypothetical protein QM759_04935 [Terricaulis sp.]
MAELCSETELRTLTAAMAEPGETALAQAQALIARYPEDARLHFLSGSMLAGLSRWIEAHGALSRAVALAPDFAIARFQLGFLQLTSGETIAAFETWGRLDALADGHYLRTFVEGLRALAHDDFATTITKLRQGMANNHENPPLNGDMQLIIDRCLPLLQDDGGEVGSETALILRQFSDRPGRPN